jgi:hypothetical protein
MKFNFARIASAVASTLMVSSTVALAAAASWPAPFVENGAANVAVVWGNSPDLSTVADITGALSAATASQGGSGGSGTPTGGDFVQLHKTSDEMNLGNAWTIIGANLDDTDLSTLLADGTYTTDENEEHEFTQKITLAANTLTHFADTDYNDEEPSIGYQLASSTAVLNYTLDFTSQPESDVSGGDLVDFEATRLNMFGREYFVLDFDNSTNDITLLDSANSAIVSEGETVTVVAGTKTYQVSIGFVSTNEAQLIINGQTTNTLAERETQKLADGSYIGIQDILVQDYAGGLKKVEFSIGAGKLFLDDGSTIELNDDDIDEIKAYITMGTPASGTREKLDKIVLEWITNDEEFLTDEQDLIMPGFGAVKFSTNAFVTPFQEEVVIGGDSDNLELTVPIEDGDAKFGLLFRAATGNFSGIGESSSKLLATTNTSVLTFNDTANHEWFVASWESSTDSESYLLQATGFEHDTDTGTNKTTIKNMVTGQDACADLENGDTCDIGSVTLTINVVTDSGSDEWVNMTAGSGVRFNRIYTEQGLRIYLPYASDVAFNDTSRGVITFNTTVAGPDKVGHGADTFWLFMDEEDKDDAIAGGTEFNFTLNDNTELEPQVSQVNNAGTGGPSGKEIGDTNEYETYIISDLATKITHDTDADRDTAKVEYHGDQSYAETFVSETGVSTGTGGELGNVAVRDT